ncbi:MAG: HAD hydrolase-like protein [Campylobacter lanienae]|uniref:HAD hydrolase-like protein n=1 Tax=Campylobacter lanienae TaxID=75658 RepID=UPI002430399E|nr:HAD hydrolase-like protein [Campylobacter lanienae]MDD7514238.1 HAD hydrolase-like protein [Campylobacter lanienae]
MIDIEKYKCIFVDLDDTLFNYTRAHDIALSEVLTRYNFSYDDYLLAKSIIKKRNLKVNSHKKELQFKVLCKIKNMHFIEAFHMFMYYKTIFLKNLKVDRLMHNFITKSNKRIIGLTNFYFIEQVEKLIKCRYKLDDLLTSEEFEDEKPNFKIVNEALKLSNCNPGDCIMIGDAHSDDLSKYGIDFYNYNCSKFIISITGKSGAGKSTISKEIANILNAEIIECDGYHKYDRFSDKWKEITHYNPEGNNLVQLALDIEKIYNKMEDIVVPMYNHDTGKLDGHKILQYHHLDYVILEGLHALYPEVTRDYVKIKIFIDSDMADLQKIERDVAIRNKTIKEVEDSIHIRAMDYDKYILRQKEYSNFLIIIKDSKFEIKSQYGNYNGNYNDLLKTIKAIFKRIKDERYI